MRTTNDVVESGMSVSLRHVAQALAVLLVMAAAETARAQVFVYPRRPGQTNVRYDTFEWRHMNLLTDDEAEVDAIPPAPRGGADPVGSRFLSRNSGSVPPYPLHHPGTGPVSSHPVALADASGATAAGTARPGNDRVSKLLERAGGLKFYYYRSEESVARRALAAVDHAYRDLVGVFDFAPPRTFPFILYNSYQDFLQTNLFPVQEGVLGVTSPRDLKLTLPYFGDHRRFQRVTRHELVHQFTIQKVQTAANDHDTYRNPIESIPLWFIEGIAEHYTHGELDDETKMLVRDLAVHQAPERGYAMANFFQPGPASFLWIYKVGQARCTFLEQTYGSGTLQQILEESYRLSLGRWQKARVDTFPALVREITGDSPDKIDDKFQDWVKQRAYETYLDASQKPQNFKRLDNIDRRIQGLESSPDGHILMYKSIDRSTGQNQIFLVDRRDMSSETRLVRDGYPDVSSLHPLEASNFDLHEERAAFVARVRGRDVIYVNRYDNSTERPQTSDASDGDGTSKDDDDFRASITVGNRTAYPLREFDLHTAEALTVSPSGERVAFIGTWGEGQRDIFVLDLEDGGSVDRITRDIYAERGLAWGDGRLVFGSDRTGHGRFNLFEVAPESGASRDRVTSAPVDHFDPTVLSNGDVMFVAYDDARANLHVARPDGIERKTDVTTGLFAPTSGPKGGVWALFHQSGRRVPVQLERSDLEGHGSSVSAPDVPASSIPRRSLKGGRDYKPFALRNWTIERGFGSLGISADGLYGQLYASAADRLRDHRLTLDFVALGSLTRTDGSLTYMNQTSRLIWGVSLFQNFRYRADESLPAVPDFVSYERFYGLRGLMRYPFDQYTYVQFALAAGGTQYALPEGIRTVWRDANPGVPAAELERRWDRRNDGPRFQTEAKVSFGFDTIKYQRQTGPIAGSSLLVSLSGDYQPGYQNLYGSLRLDGETYLPIWNRINVMFRVGAGASFGGRLSRQFFLSSYYTLRGVPFGTDNLLLGRHYGYSTLELQFPLNFLVRIPYIDLEGVVGADFGGVGGSVADVWDKRVFDVAAGVNFGFGPLVLRLHFAQPLDVGGRILPNNGELVPNLSLGWRYL